MIVPPSGRPPNVPVTASAASLATMVNTFPVTGTYAPMSESVPPAMVTVPVTFTLSYCVPSVVPWISTTNAPATLRSPVLMTPGLKPGASVPPAFTFTAPRAPLPPSVPPAFTSTMPGMEPVTMSVPPLMVFTPPCVLVPDSVRIPAPVFTNGENPWTAPLKVVLVPSPPTVRPPPPTARSPAPVSEPTVDAPMESMRAPALMINAPLFTIVPARAAVPVIVVEPAWVSGGPKALTWPAETSTLPGPVSPAGTTTGPPEPANSIVALSTKLGGRKSGPVMPLPMRSTPPLTLKIPTPKPASGLKWVSVRVPVPVLVIVPPPPMNVPLKVVLVLSPPTVTPVPRTNSCPEPASEP
jgi:hypothetical protein